MSLKVIGAGFGRTGTLSLKLALEQLGFGPCYHMMELFPRPQHVPLWRAAADGGKGEWAKIFDGFVSTVDWPSTRFWKELVAAYPDAKVILTPRDPERWFESFSNTILPAISHEVSKSDERRPWWEMVHLIIAEQTFGGDLSKENVLAVYNRHNDEVRRTVPKDRLLEFDVKQGWEPLCAFLEVPVPADGFPRTNSTEEFQQRQSGE